MKIFYIHGYNSSGNSDTAKNLRKYFPDLISPTYDCLNPSKSLAELKNMLDEKELNSIVASSLGGWYALRLAERVKNVELYLFNPATDPATTLEKYGVKGAVLNEYKRIQLNSGDTFDTNVTLFLSIDDDVVPYGAAKKLFEYLSRKGAINLKTIMTEGGHQMGKNTEMVAKTIEKNIEHGNREKGKGSES